MCVYFPERGTYPFILQNRSIFTLRQLQQAFRKVYPGAFALQSLNYPEPAPVSAARQNSLEQVEVGGAFGAFAEAWQ